MERLTIRTPTGAALKMDDNYPSEDAARHDLMVRYRIAMEKLAAYEDTGLEPEEVRGPYDNLKAHLYDVETELNAYKRAFGEGVVEDYTKMRKGSKIFYVDFELGFIESGIVDSVHFNRGEVTYFSVDFVESKDYDQFYGSSLGKTFFLSHDNAVKALLKGDDTPDGQ